MGAEVTLSEGGGHTSRGTAEWPGLCPPRPGTRPSQRYPQGARAQVPKLSHGAGGWGYVVAPVRMGRGRGWGRPGLHTLCLGGANLKARRCMDRAGAPMHTQPCSHPLADPAVAAWCAGALGVGQGARLGAPGLSPSLPALACDKGSLGPVILLNLTLGYFEQEIKGDYHQPCGGATLPRWSCCSPPRSPEAWRQEPDSDGAPTTVPQTLPQMHLQSDEWGRACPAAPTGRPALDLLGAGCLASWADGAGTRWGGRGAQVSTATPRGITGFISQDGPAGTPASPCRLPP